MSIIKIHKDSNYTVMSNYHFKEREMSLKAKGLLSLMLSLPEDWDYSIAGLATLSSDGESAVKTALRELESFNYLTRERVYENGKIVDWQYNIFECPQKKLDGDFQQVEKQHVENQPQLNKKELNKKELNKKLTSKEVREPSDAPTFKLSSKKPILKKPNLFTQCMNELNSRDYDKHLKEALIDYLKVRLEMKDKQLYFNSWKGLLNKLEREFPEKERIGVVFQSIERGYASFFPIGGDGKKVGGLKFKESGAKHVESFNEEDEKEEHEFHKECQRKGMRTHF